MKYYFGSCFVCSSRIFIHFFNLLMRLCNNLAPGTVKSKSLVNWPFIFWKTGSCTVAWARRAKDSDAAELNELFIFCEDDMFSANRKIHIREKLSPFSNFRFIIQKANESTNANAEGWNKFFYEIQCMGSYCSFANCTTILECYCVTFCEALS